MNRTAHRRARRLPGILMLLLLLTGTLAAFPTGAGAASYVVTNCNDSGPGSLRNAIYTANGNVNGPYTITFNLSPACDTITLTSSDLPITQDMTIQGPASSTLRVSGNYTNRVFIVYPGVTATISDLSISSGVGGPLGGGGVRNAGTLTIANCIISDNVSAQFGGGVYNDGTLTITNSSIRYNAAEHGGGVASIGPLTITDSAISDNSVTGVGGGVYATATASINRVSMQGNTAATGGGVANFGTLSLSNALVSGNTAQSSGGGLYGYGTTYVIASTIRGNMAESGGGFINSGSMTVTASTLNGNTASTGGGTLNTGKMTIDNSTISGNSAATTGGGVRNAGDGQSQIMSSTITSNHASGSGGGLHIEGPVLVDSTIVARNTAAISSPDAHGDLIDGRYNLLGNDTGNTGLTNGVNGNIVGSGGSPVEPLLGPLQDNGGPTATRQLLAGSPALNHIPVSACPITIDQRGLARPQGLNCDIGAYEAFVQTYYQACLYAGSLSKMRPAELMAQPLDCGHRTPVVLVAGGNPTDASYHACLYAGVLSRVGYEPVADCGRGTKAAFAFGTELWGCLHNGTLSQVSVSQPNCARGTRIGFAL